MSARSGALHCRLLSVANILPTYPACCVQCLPTGSTAALNHEGTFSQVDPVRVRRAAATSRLFMQRILQQFGAVGRPGGDSDEDEWEEDEEAGEDAAGPARRRRGTAQRPPPPQVGVRWCQFVIDKTPWMRMLAAWSHHAGKCL